MRPQADPGTYVLVLILDHSARIGIGSLGPKDFAAGHYLYVGSAQGGLRSRVGRHLRAEKRLHWHIDYLLRQARVIAVWYVLGTARLECCWAQMLSHAPGLTPTPHPFGASDCACETHLFYSTHKPDIRHLRRAHIRKAPPDAGPLQEFRIRPKSR